MRGKDGGQQTNQREREGTGAHEMAIRLIPSSKCSMCAFVLVWCVLAFLPLYLYPRSVIDHPPSVDSSSLTVADEARNRIIGCVIMAKAGKMLQLSDERAHRQT